MESENAIGQPQGWGPTELRSSQGEAAGLLTGSWKAEGWEGVPGTEGPGYHREAELTQAPMPGEDQESGP